MRPNESWTRSRPAIAAESESVSRSAVPSIGDGSPGECEQEGREENIPLSRPNTTQREKKNQTLLVVRVRGIEPRREHVPILYEKWHYQPLHHTQH